MKLKLYHTQYCHRKVAITQRSEPFVSKDYFPLTLFNKDVLKTRLLLGFKQKKPFLSLLTQNNVQQFNVWHVLEKKKTLSPQGISKRKKGRPGWKRPLCLLPLQLLSLVTSSSSQRSRVGLRKAPGPLPTLIRPKQFLRISLCVP